jgi:hypothetical protein
MAARRRRPPKAIAPEELATILAYAELHSDKDACERFGVSARTLQRHRAELRSGKHPALAALVAEKKQLAVERCEDRLEQVYQAALDALQKRIADDGLETRMSGRELVGAIHILGNQLVTRKALTGDDDQPVGDDREGSPAQAAGAGGQAAPACGGRAALH